MIFVTESLAAFAARSARLREAARTVPHTDLTDLYRERDLPDPHGPDALVFGEQYNPEDDPLRRGLWRGDVPCSCPCGVTWAGTPDSACWACGDSRK